MYIIDAIGASGGLRGIVCVCVLGRGRRVFSTSLKINLRLLFVVDYYK